MVKALQFLSSNTHRAVDLGVKGVVTIGLLGLTIGLNACQNKTVQQPAQPEAQAPATVAAGQPLPVPPNGQPFLQPTVPQLAPDQMPTLPIKGLTPATKPESRLSQLKVTKNTRDPFSTLTPGISIIPALPSQRPGAKPVAKPNPQKVRQVAKAKNLKKPQRAIPSIQPIASLPAPMPAAPVMSIPAPAIVPPIEVAEAPAPPPIISATHLADNVEISGVMQVGGKTMVIAKAINENSARYVQAGDSLAGGQVYIKSVRLSPMGEPIVVLEQNGVEVTKSVGGAGSRVATLR